MAFEVTGLREPSVADITLVRFFARVRSVVPGEGGAVCKGLGAHVTLVWSVAGVRAHVPGDGVSLRESALTDGAFEWFFSAVGPQVDCEA